MMFALLNPCSTLKIIGVFNLTHKYMEERINLTCYFVCVCACVKMGVVPVENPVFAVQHQPSKMSLDHVQTRAVKGP